MKTHCMKGTKLYNTWHGMRDRTRRKSHPQYKNYGGRGIKVCEEWNDFNTFYKWAVKSGYKEGLTIDRIDNDDGYNPKNCRWATRKEQANNKRNNHILTYNGESHNIEEWAKILEMTRGTLVNRVRRGWSMEEIFNTPYGARRISGKGDI